MRVPAWFSTLKFRIVAIVAATGVLAAWGTANLLLGVTQSELTRVLLAGDLADRERTATLFAGKVDTLRQAMTEVASHSRGVPWRDAAAMEHYLLAQSGLNALFDVVFAARADGTVFARVERGTPRHDALRVADREYFVRAMRSVEPVLSDPFVGRVRHVPLMVVAVAVPAADGQPQGMIGGVVALRAAALFAGMGDRRAGNGEVDLVINRAGTIVSHPQPDRLLARAAQEPGLADVVAAWRASGSPIELNGSARLSQGYLVSMAGIARTDWMHVRVTPEAIALQPLAAARRQALSVAAAAGALAALVSGVLAWALVRPISRLRERAERMLRADTPELEGWPADSGEVGAMGRAFRQLLEQNRERQRRTNDLVLQLEAVLDNAEVGIALTRNGRFELVSRRLCQIFRCEREQMAGHRTRIIYASDAAFDELAQRARASFMAHGSFAGELELVRADGESFWARMLGRAVTPGDLSRGTIWVVDDITQAREHREQLAWAATHDALTGLANRTAFESLLQHATVQAAQHPFCAMFIDLDHFKQVNDTGGHAAGDRLLRELAQALSARLRKSDTLARFGGDEFAALLPDCPVSQARLIAEKLRAAVEDHVLHWHGEALRVGASIGLVSVDGTHASAADVLRAADAACYKAKREGRNRVAAVSASA